jgi:hypothetical protein
VLFATFYSHSELLLGLLLDGAQLLEAGRRLRTKIINADNMYYTIFYNDAPSKINIYGTWMLEDCCMLEDEDCWKLDEADCWKDAACWKLEDDACWMLDDCWMLEVCWKLDDCWKDCCAIELLDSTHKNNRYYCYLTVNLSKEIKLKFSFIHRKIILKRIWYHMLFSRFF